MDKPDQSANERKKLHESFLKAFSKETDRAVGIISVCYLDDLLEKLIRASYVKDPKLSSLFKNDQLLQSFFAKINLAYFSGLIPEVIYHDLKLIGEIRNRFAHAVIADLKFTDEIISQKINKFAQLPPNVIDIYPPRLKFELIVVHTGAFLQKCEELLPVMRPPNLVELFKLDESPFQVMILTPSEIKDIMQKAKRQVKHKK
jgi:DNA-binding MltR family transcriptional regulator